MKLNKKMIVVLMLVLAAGLGWFVFFKPKTATHEAGQKAGAKYFCPMHPNYTSDKPGDCPICHMRLVPVEQEEGGRSKVEGGRKKILFYRHPMRPDVSSPVPAKDEMGMDYIPVYEEETAAEDQKSVCILHECPHIKEGQVCPMLVLAEPGEEVECPYCKGKIEMTEKEKAVLAKEGYAPVLISPKKQQLIGIRTSVVETKRVRKVIRAVGKIAYDPELYQAQAEYIQAMKSLKGAEANPSQNEWAQNLVDSARTKLILLGLNPQMIEALGESDAPDKSLLYSIPGGHAWIYANIYEYELPLVKVGDVLEIEIPAVAGQKFTGEIRSIDTVVDPMTRSVRVRAVVENKEGLLKPGMFVNTALKVDLGNVLAVPEEAVFATGTSMIVFVDKGSGVFDPRRVALGQQAEGVYEVKEGLKEGERVITNGNFLVDSESKLKAALTSMSGDKK